METESYPESPPYIAKVSYDIFRRIALNTIAIGTHPPTPQDLRALCCLPRVSRKFHDAISITKNPEFYATVFRLMFDVKAVQRRLGPQSTAPFSLSSELQKRTRLLRRIKTHVAHVSESETMLLNDQTVLEDHALLFLMVLENEGRNMQQLHHAGVGRFLSMLISRVIEESRPPTIVLQSPFLALLFPLIWMTGSSDMIIKGNLQHREDVLNLLHRFVVREYQLGSTKVPEEQALGTSVECFGITLKLTHPDLASYARLCTFTIFHMVEPGISLNNLSGQDHGTLTMAIMRTHSHRYDGFWRRCVSVDSPKSTEHTTVVQLDPPYSVGTFAGIWKGSFFIPSKINGDTETGRHATYEVTMQCCLTEYHSSTVEASVTWDGEENSENSLSRAWLPVRAQWYETEGALMIYDPTKMEWFCYEPHVHSTENTFDTIILGKTLCNQYTLHGRVRHRDGMVALVRTPINPMCDFLGTWVFQGQVLEQTVFVGDWRCAASSEVAPGRQGWFKWSKYLD